MRRTGITRTSWLTASIGFAASVAAAFWSSGTGDYVPAPAVENPAPAIGALAHGSVARFVDLHPVMGSFSLLLRAPIVALSDALGGGLVLGYRLGVLLCFVPVLIVGAWLAAEIEARGRSRREAIAFGVLVAVNPVTLDAVRYGHPEELLGGGLAVLAVICAARGWVAAAALALALAIETKQWTLLAVLPVVFAAPRPSRSRIAAVAGTVGVVLALAAPLASWGAYREKVHELGHTAVVSHYSAWTVVSSRVSVAVHGLDAPVTIHRLPAGLSREYISLLIPVLCALLVVAVARRRRWNLSEEDAMALLAISFLLRAALDSVVLLYYFAPMVLALAWWEVRRRGIPIGTAAATAFVWLLFREVDDFSGMLGVALFVGGCALVCAYVALPLVGRELVPARTRPLGKAPRADHGVDAGTG